MSGGEPGMATEWNQEVFSYFLGENLLFLLVSTAFLGIVGWAWRSLKPYRLPDPLPGWFRVWFLSVQIGGGLLPLGVLLWSLWGADARIPVVLIAYLVNLGLQVLAESLTLRQFRSVVWVMVPYLYIPFRLWQLYEGLTLFAPGELGWFQTLVVAEIILWMINYSLDLAQLPRLLGWPQQD